MTATRLRNAPPASGPNGLSPAQTYPKSIELFSQGQMLDEVLHVDSGWVKLSATDRTGRERILELAFGGMWLGTAAVISRTPSPVSAVTCTAARLARIPAAEFRALLERDPDVSRQIHEMHARELCRHVHRLLDLTSLTSRERLERVMCHFIAALELQPTDHGTRLNIPLQHRELAELILVTPEHLSRLLTQMEREGVIQRDKGWLLIADVRRLSADGDPSDDSDAPWCLAENAK
jgi:CRP/FNR family transcriptional regulator, cyclic AMP receptor protein